MLDLIEHCISFHYINWTYIRTYISDEYFLVGSVWGKEGKLGKLFSQAFTAVLGSVGLNCTSPNGQFLKSICQRESSDMRVRINDIK